MADVKTLSITRTADGNGLALPSYTSPYHAALNLQAAVPSSVRLESGDRVYIPIGFAIGVPDGFCGLIVSQPELAREQGLIVLDAPQLVHPANRAPLFLLLQNMSSHQVILRRGDIVAQLLIQPVVQVAWRDFSEGTQIQGEVVKEKDVLVDSLGKMEQESVADKMVSSRRVYKDPRHRFSEEES